MGQINAGVAPALAGSIQIVKAQIGFPVAQASACVVLIFACAEVKTTQAEACATKEFDTHVRDASRTLEKGGADVDNYFELRTGTVASEPLSALVSSTISLSHSTVIPRRTLSDAAQRPS